MARPWLANQEYRSSIGNWRTGDVTVALGANSLGSRHADASVTFEGGYIVSGTTFRVSDHCRAVIGDAGCQIANEIRAVRRLKAAVNNVTSLTLITHNREVATLLEGWRTGEITTTPDWYVLDKSNNSLTIVMNEMRQLGARAKIRVASEGSRDSRLVVKAEQLSRALLFAVRDGRDRHWTKIRIKQILADLPTL